MRFLQSLLAVITVVTMLTLGQAEAASKAELDVQVKEALSEFKSSVSGGSGVLSDASGILVFPKVYQAGFGIGGQYGEGALLIKNATHAYYRIAAGSIGFQLGGQRKSIIMVFLNPQALNKFLDSKGWEVGADASVAVITTGAEGGIDSKSLANQAVIAFVTDQKGLMYTLSLEGSKISKINKK